MVQLFYVFPLVLYFLAVYFYVVNRYPPIISILIKIDFCNHPFIILCIPYETACMGIRVRPWQRDEGAISFLVNTPKYWGKRLFWLVWLLVSTIYNWYFYKLSVSLWCLYFNFLMFSRISSSSSFSRFHNSTSIPEDTHLPMKVRLYD